MSDDYNDYLMFLKLRAVLQPHLAYVQKRATAQYGSMKDFQNIIDTVRRYRMRRQVSGDDLTFDLRRIRRSMSYDTQSKVIHCMFMAKEDYISVKVGEKPFARKIQKDRSNRYTYEISVGWRWVKYVYDPFYKDKGERPYADNLILCADRLMVNNRNVRLYSCRVFNRLSGAVNEMYIGQAALGEKNDAVIRDTVASAVKGAEDLLQKEMNNILTS